jgi:hypothetical protein
MGNKDIVMVYLGLSNLAFGYWFAILNPTVSAKKVKAKKRTISFNYLCTEDSESAGGFFHGENK